MQFARSGRGSKLRIELLRKKPPSGTSTSEPKPEVSEVMSAVTLPSASAATIWLVPERPEADGRVEMTSATGNSCS